MLIKKQITGLYVPLITPMLFGDFDATSMTHLVQNLEDTVDGFVPCLSTGEGAMVNDIQWEHVVKHVRSITKKPVIAGIKRNTIEQVVVLAKKAEKIGCDAFILPVPSMDWSTCKEYFNQILQKTDLPFIIYNTAEIFLSDPEKLIELDKNDRILAIKDSSMNPRFFEKICHLRVQSTLQMSVLQGMEQQLDVPQGCDGYLVSLLNVEPKLVQSMFQTKSKTLYYEILKKFMHYNLGGDWFITLKAILYERKIIRSSEQVQQFVAIDPRTLQKLKNMV